MPEPIDITKLPIKDIREYWPPGTDKESKLRQTLKVLEQEAETFKNEALASFWKDGRKPYIPQWMKIFLVNRFQMEGLLTGMIKATNIPTGARLYDIRPYRHDDILDVWGMWMVHPSFREYRSGDCVEAEPIQVEPIKE